MPIIGAPDVRAHMLERLRGGPLSEEASRRVDILEETLRNESDMIVRSLCENGSSKALYGIGYTFMHSPVDGPIPIEGLLRVFLHHTSAERVPRLPANPPREDDISERAWACFPALGHERFTKVLASNPDLLAQYVAGWPGIFKWTEYFCAQRIIGKRSSDDTLEAVETVSQLLNALFSNPTMSDLIQKTDGIVAVAGHLWAYRHTVKSKEGLAEYVEFSCARILRSLLLEGGPTLETIDKLDTVARIVDGGGDDPFPCARLALKRLKRTMVPGTPEDLHEPLRAMELSCHLYVVFILSRLPGHALTFALLRENATWTVARALVLVSRTIDEVGSNYQLVDCVNGSISFIRYALMRDESFRWVCQALDAGLLHGIASVCLSLHLMGKDPGSEHLRACLRHIVHETLPLHLVYKSVVKVTQRELADVSPDLVRERVERSFIADDWKSIASLVDLRAKVAELPKDFKKQGNVSCESIACGKWGKKSELKRCAGCQYVYYCSKECQAAAWPSHKRMCKLKNQMNVHRQDPRNVPLFLETDAQFLRALFGADANVHLEHLRALAKRDHPKTPAEHHIICIDYTDPEWPAGKCSLKNIFTYKFQEQVSADEPNAENITGQNQEMLGMVQRNPGLWQFIEGTFMFGEQKFSRNLLVRPNLWTRSEDSRELEHALNWQHMGAAQFGCPTSRHGLPNILSGFIGDILDSAPPDDDWDSEEEEEDSDDEEEILREEARRKAENAKKRAAAQRRRADVAAAPKPPQPVTTFASRFMELRIADLD